MGQIILASVGRLAKLDREHKLTKNLTATTIRPKQLKNSAIWTLLKIGNDNLKLFEC